MKTEYFDLRDIKGPQKQVEDQITAAAEILKSGGLLGIPTETVYGLAANALDPQAVRRIFEAKGRPQDNPLILHVASANWLPRYCRNISPLAYTLTRKFWPGPLTLVLKCNREVVPGVTTAGLDTVAVRCPAHPVALAILRQAGVPVAAPSANSSGRPSCTTAEAVLEDMGGKIEGVVDGSPCQVGVESTILDLTCDPPRLLRPGGMPLEEIEQVIGPVEIDRAVNTPLKAGEQPKAPGMKYRHYAPRAPVTVVTGAPGKTADAILRRAQPGDGVICFDEYAPLFKEQVVQTLGLSQDQMAQAQRVFEVLRSFDSSDVPRIFAQCPESQGLGLAVSNRLKKAAGFHVVEADKRRVVLGITGGSGSGKSSALEAIRELGGTVIDCDTLYGEMLRTTRPLRQAIEWQFPGVFDGLGKLNRPELARQAFSDPERLEKLNEIIFSFLVPELERQIQGEGVYAIDAINLMESGASRLCDRTVAILAPKEARVRRIMARDGITEEYALLRIEAQKPEEYYRAECDDVLKNEAQSPEAFRREARGYFQSLIRSILGYTDGQTV